MAANSAATTRVRSTTRARRLLVLRASTDEALVRMAGATMAVSTAKGLPAPPLVVYCTATLYPPLVRSARFLHDNFVLQQIMAIYVSARLGSASSEVSARIPARNREYAAAAIIAALSVDSALLGKNTWTPAAFARSSNAARNRLFAATPPETSTLSTLNSSAAFMVRSTRSRTTAF